MSINSGYGGNVLLGKKCFALRIASYLGRQRGLDGGAHADPGRFRIPRGRSVISTAAFPSACGKTNLAMLIPPEGYRKKGYKVWCVGDDIAWLRIGADGRLWAVNPENGFFGVAPGTNAKSNPNALASTQKGTIFTNVALNLDDNTVWWERTGQESAQACPGLAGAIPGDRTTAQGRAAHPNSRFTAPAENCPCISPEFDNPHGRAHLRHHLRRPPGQDRAPGLSVPGLAARGVRGLHHGLRDHRRRRRRTVGVVRRDPMAMLPFCGYHMGDYLAALAGYGARRSPHPPEDLQCQLVPHR